MAEVRFGSPLPVHIPFHRSAAPERAAIGAFGSGKSYALIDEAIACCLEQPGVRVVVARRTIPALKDTTEAVFFDRLPHELYVAGTVSRGGNHAQQFTFPNGSVVLFKGLDDWRKLMSLNLAWVFVDEASEIDAETWTALKSRVRQRDPTAEAARRGYTAEITRRGMVLACNPAGHNWIWRRFVDEANEDYQAGSAYFRSTSFDNPFLPVDTLEGYLSFPEAWIKRYVLCQFDDFAGQIYETWNYADHVIKPYLIPKGAMIWMGMDPGSRNPTAGVWAHVDRPESRPPRLVAVAEYQAEEMLSAAAHAAKWRVVEKVMPPVRWRVADPATINLSDRGTTNSLKSQYSRLGFQFNNGPRTHKDRIPMLADLIQSGRFVVTENCPLTFEAIKNYQWEDLSPAARSKGADAPERPLKKDDHLVDCSQYLSSRWAGQPRTPAPPSDELSQAERFSREVRQTIRRNIARNLSPGACDLGVL